MPAGWNDTTRLGQALGRYQAGFSYVDSIRISHPSSSLAAVVLWGGSAANAHVIEDANS